MVEKGSEVGEKLVTSSNPSSIENPAIQITTHKLNGENFLRWAQSVRFFISGRGKTGYLDCTHKPVLPKEAGYQTWFVENSMVMTWLINSMEPEINQGYLLYTTAKEIWDAANQMYSNLGNDSKLY